MNTDTDADTTIRCMAIPSTDLEINANMTSRGLVVRVNKGDVMICRVRPEDAGETFDAGTLADFSTFAPDFVFKVGDNAAGMERLKRSVGVA